MTPFPPNLLLFFLFLLLIFAFLGAPQTLNPNQEQSILLQLKSQWSNPTTLSHWTPSSHHCTWPEIVCDGDQSVSGLDLSNKTLTTTIPSSICNLTNLTYLNLNYNFLPGFFPTVLYNCSKLEYLDLSQNNFIGPIPDDIYRLSTRIRFLNLEANNFTGDIPSSIGRLSSLESLILGSNLFNSSIAPEIGDLVNLEKLVLNYNPFQPQRIPSNFLKMEKLKDFWITEANLIGEIPEDIGNMSALEFLDLSCNNMNGTIPGSIFLLRNLTTLFLFRNRFSGPIPAKVSIFNIQVLDLSQNNLNGTIPDDVGKLVNLTGLALHFNNLSGEIPSSISKLPNLENLRLHNNNLTGNLPMDFGLYSNLVNFEVSSNQFSGELPRNICENQALEGMISFQNNLTGNLPDSLGNCTSLKMVMVYENQLDGEIPNGLWISRNLETLILSDNSFSGLLPDEIGPNISSLELSNNRFSGRIPARISSSKSLTLFKVSNNALSGEIPDDITSLSSLTTLLLDRNRLSGSLPSSIVSWRSLTDLNVSLNQLSGEIPGSLGLLPSLSYLDLSRNELSGRIPAEFGNLVLNSLNLSSNRLFGRIPGRYENGAFDRSFLGNAGLCSTSRYVGIATCENRGPDKRSSNDSKVVVIVSCLAGVLIVIGFVYAVIIWRSCRRRREDESDVTWKVTSFQKLDFTERSILSSLTDENVIGSGGSGKVYSVPISSSGRFVAVKKIWNDAKMDRKLEKEFEAEVEILGTIRHLNIVRLLCCISSDKANLLVYEYMQNHSLDRWLHGKRRTHSSNSSSIHPMVLDWPQRMQIAIGAARGLYYMHHEFSPPIIHRDIKSSNILLDSQLNAKIADFGLARMLIKNREVNTMSVVAGSFGYIAPEYARTRRVNEKIDVYSFGVILLELVTGREAHSGDENSSLVEWAWRYNQNVDDALDKDIKDTIYMEEIQTVFKLGLICTRNAPNTRPSMKDVLQILIRCGRSQPLKKIDQIENDVAPLLHNSVQRKVLGDDGVFAAV